MYSLKEASTEYVTALEETEKKLAVCPAEVGVTRCRVTQHAYVYDVMHIHSCMRVCITPFK